MKAEEIIIRQDRVVYTLMVLLAGMGLVWSFWQHQHHATLAVPAAQTQAVPSSPAASPTPPGR